MSEMKSNDSVVDDNNTKIPKSMSVDSKSKTVTHQCKICGARAQYSNYGATTCFPCKMFFRRNAEMKKGQLTCTYDDHCKININNRHICAACRLAECFANGMQTELIRCHISKQRAAK